MPLLDAMAHDVLLCCSSCGAHQVCCFLTGLALFQHRATYSSAGGDHLIPWASSSLLFPRQLPSWPGQLPAPALWARQPAIVQWPQPAAAAAAGGEAVAEQEVLPDQQQQEDSGLMQQQEQELQHEMHQPSGVTSSSSSTVPLPCTIADAAHAGIESPAAAAAAAASTATEDSSSTGATAAAAAAARAAGPLSQRLLALQSVGPWSHFHVVWPRLCLGSSHCNIQYNGPLNFVGRAVVAHVVASLVTAADRQPIGWGEGVRGARAGLRALVDPEVPCTIAAECVEGKE